MLISFEGIIERVDSSARVFPVVVVKKKTGGIRLCVDLREPNRAVVTDSHPLPQGLSTDDVPDPGRSTRCATLFG